MFVKRAITLGSLFGVGLVLLGSLVTCRHGFFVSEGGGGRLGFAESSGIVASRAHPGVFWTHADSGAPPVLFAVNEQAQLLAQFRLDGVQNVDWEDIAVDDQQNLYIADSGNNRSARRDLVIYRVREPDPTQASGDADRLIHVDAKIHFRYPDQIDFPASIQNFDAESLFWTAGRLYLLSKHRADTRTTLYRFPSAEGRAEVVLEKISDFDLGGGELQFGGMATGADITPDGRTLVILSYRGLFFFEAPPAGDDFLARPLKRIELGILTLKQCEAVAWFDGDVIVTNETGRVFRVQNPLDSGVERFPAP